MVWDGVVASLSQTPVQTYVSINEKLLKPNILNGVRGKCYYSAFLKSSGSYMKTSTYLTQWSREGLEHPLNLHNYPLIQPYPTPKKLLLPEMCFIFPSVGAISL